MRYLFHLNKYFLKYKWHVLLGILFVSLSNYFRILQPQAIRKALNEVTDLISQHGQSHLLGNTELMSALSKSLLQFSALILLYAIIMGIFMYAMRQSLVVMSRLIEYDMRKELYQHFQSLDAEFYLTHRTGDLMSRISEDVAKVRMYLGPGILYFINLLSLFIWVLYAMLSVSPILTIYTLLPLPILSVSIYFVSAIINRKSEKIQAQLGGLTAMVQESFSGINVIKSYVREDSFKNYFKTESNRYLDLSLDLAKVNALFFPLILLLIGVSNLITIYVGGNMMLEGSISAGNLVEFVIYINMLTWPFTAVGWIASIIQQAAASQKRILEILHTQPKIKNSCTDKSIIQGGISFKEVSFTYPSSGVKALKNININISPGQKIALIGETGSGKSAFIELLLRIYDTTEGQIELDGQEIKKMNLYDLREQISYVPQDVFLFSDTIQNNISFGKPDTQFEEIVKAAKMANILDEIESLPDKFDTIVGERGVSLSGGQKQRISIARALIKKPKMLIFDDALSAVDPTTQAQIFSSLSSDQSKMKATLIVSTHNITLIHDFDQIIVLDQGEIIELGSPQEIYAQKGYYYEVYNEQMSRM